MKIFSSLQSKISRKIELAKDGIIGFVKSFVTGIFTFGVATIDFMATIAVLKVTPIMYAEYNSSVRFLHQYLVGLLFVLCCLWIFFYILRNSIAFSPVTVIEVLDYDQEKAKQKTFLALPK